MAEAQGKIYFESGLDNSRLRSGAAEAKSLLHGIGDSAETEGRRIEDTFRGLGAAVAGVFAVSQLKEFTVNVAKVRGEFQQLEMSFKTLLGSADKADALMSQLINTALITPFGMSDIAKASKQLLAYGVAAEDVNDTLIRLGDIAAGLSIPIGDLAYLYGTTMVQGRLFTQDLRQFTGRGIPLTEELAKQFGVAKEKVGELVTAGKVGFPEVQKAIISLTSAGSKFGGLMEAQSQTIAGQISNLEDAVEQMMNNIGKQSEGFISGAIGAVSGLVENYEKVGRVIAEVIAAYGVYKATIMTLAALENLRYQATLAQMAGMTKMQAVTDVLRQKTAALNTVLAKNPYVLAGAAVAALAVGIYKLATVQTDAEKAQAKLNRTTGEYNKAVASERVQIDSLFARLKAAKEGTEEYEAAKKAIISQYGNYLSGLGKEIEALQDVEGAYKAITVAAVDAAKARALERAASGAADTYAEKEASAKKEVKKLLEKKFGGRTGADGISLAETYYWKIVPVIEGKEELTDELREVVGQFDRSFSGGGMFGNGNYTNNALKEQLRSAAEAKRVYEGVMAEANRLYGSGVAATAEEKKKAEEPAKATRDKAYWADLKQKATEELEALTDIEAAGRRGQELKRKIAEYNGRLASYGTETKSGKTSDDTEQRRERFLSEYGTYQQRLKQLSDEWDNTIASFADGTAERGIAEKQKKYALAAFSYDWLKDNTLDRDAVREALEEQLDAEIATLEGAAKEAAEARKIVALAEFDAETDGPMLDYLKEFGTMEERRLAIAQEYDRKIAASADEWTKKSLGKQKENALFEFDSANDGKMKQFFIDPAKQSRALLKQNIDYAATLTEKYREQPEVLKDINAQLSQMQEEYDSLDIGGYEAGVDAVVSRVSELNRLYRRQNELKEQGAAADVSEVEANRAAIERARQSLKKSLAATGITAFVDGLSRAAELMQQIADASGDISLADSAAMLQSFTQNLSSAYEGFKTGGWIGAIVGGVSDWLQQGISAYAQARIAEEEYARSHEQFIHRLNVANLSLDDTLYDTLFGDKGITRGVDGWKKAQSAMEQYMAAVGRRYEMTSEDIADRNRKDQKMLGGFGAAVFSGGLTAFTSGPWTDKRTSLYKQQEDAMARGLTELQAMSVKVKSRNGFQKFWGAEDRYKSLYDIAPQLWDENGDFNVAAAKEFLETETRITDAQRNQIENVIELKEAYDDAMAAIDENIESIFGSLGEDMADAIWDSVVNGGDDAWDKFQDIGAEAIANLGKQMLKEMIITDYLEQYKDRFREAYKSGTPEEVAANVAALTAEMMNGAKENIDIWTEAIQGYSDAAKQSGYDLSEAAERSTASRGIASMSQESADELNGRFTAIQGHTYQINENVTAIREQHQALVATAGSILAHVMGIHDDTDDIRETLGEVRSIVKSTSDDILLKGVKIR